MARFGSLLAVAIGGMVGSLARWGVVASVDQRWHDPAVLGLNIAGSLLLGALIGGRRRISDEVDALLGTGFAGGLTTFSTFAVAVAASLEDGALLDAAGIAVGTPLAALVAGGIGYRLGVVLSRPALDGRRRRRRPARGGGR